MPVASDQGGGSFQLPPVGTHAARCIWVIDLGTHKDQFGGKGKVKLIRKVRIGWELPNEKAIFDEERGEESFVCGQDYTLSLGERANLRHMLESWRGRDFTEQELKGFDMKVLIGKPCLVNIIHKKSGQGRDYHQVASVTPLPRGMGCPKPTLERLVYDVENGEDATFEKLPEWIQERIAECEEWNSSPGGSSSGHWGPEEPEPGTDEFPPEEPPAPPEPPQPPAKPRRRPPEPESHKQAAPPPRQRSAPPPQPPEPDEDEIPF